MSPFTIILSVVAASLISIILLPIIFRFACKSIGSSLRSRTESRRAILLHRANVEEADVARKASRTSQLDGDWEKIDASSLPSSGNGEPAADTWTGVIAFFHPFCNAGGGGERVLWAAIRATQQRYPGALCVVYTGDHDVDKTAILTNVTNRFDIRLHAPRVTFLYLSTRQYVLASTWPRFTLLGQSLGSLLLAWDAFNLVVPDVFIDTMGYAFALALSKLLFPTVPTAAYVHYPTISTDMLGSLDDVVKGRGVNAGLGKGWTGTAKRQYWQLFAKLYSWVGGYVDVVMTNSSWTQNHMIQLWTHSRRASKRTSEMVVVYPPTSVEEMEQSIKVDEETEKTRKKQLIFISQFRPEKCHDLIITSFAEFKKSHLDLFEDKQGKLVQGAPKLVLAGSVRDGEDNLFVYKLRLLGKELGLRDNVEIEYLVNQKWAVLLELLRTSSVGVNGMWNEHFGIGVVEYQAAGLISVVNDSGGPKMDIVVDVDGLPTGYHASTSSQFAAGFWKALSLPPDEALAMRLRARKNAKRFTEEVFREKWNAQLEKLMLLAVK